MRDIHDVHARTRPILIESSYEAIELLRSRTDTHEQWNFDEDKYDACDPETVSLAVSALYRHMIEKMMRREAWKIFAIPRAMQTIVRLPYRGEKVSTKDG